MATLTQQEKQVLDSFRSLDPARRRYVLLELAHGDADAWSRLRPQGESTLQEAARQRGLDWDHMDDRQRQDFVEEFLDGHAL
jgi:hypothetical protein